MNMKEFLLVGVLVIYGMVSFSQQNATVQEYLKTFKTYPFSDPDPVPEMGKIYPYYRFDGYAHTPVNKDWKVVELENEFIKVMVLPEIGGKIWAAIEKSTGKSFIYYNRVVKFRDVAMRGPWTSGGLEPNYGIVGHTPNCATPVDYTILKKNDGSVSCVVGVLDLLTRSYWRIDINLEKDKAYFTTKSTWYNASLFEQPYYHWMNGALKGTNDLQFIFPGTKFIGHGGEFSDWPKDKGRDLSYYKNNDFGSYKSYHVFGRRSDFWGGYYHDEDFGMARYSTYDDKAGKKIWIWGLSREGMIWENLLTDEDGQYVEVQSGRLFNQPGEGSSVTPFKNRGFTPNATDTWTELWMPVMKTKGFVSANDDGVLNILRENGSLKLYFMPVRPVKDEIIITLGDQIIYSKNVELKPLEVFTDSMKLGEDAIEYSVRLGKNKIIYETTASSGMLARPVETPKEFNWNSVQGLYLQGKELIRQRMYVPAEEKLRAALKEDAYYLPALGDMAMILYRQMKYAEALEMAKKGLSVDSYDPAANYYYGLINEQTGQDDDAKDGYSIASQAVEYRTASFSRLANMYLKEKDFEKTIDYTNKALDFNKYALDAFQLLAVVHRLQGNRERALEVLDTLNKIDPLNHFANFERFVWDSSAWNRQNFTGLIRNEMPVQTFLELAAWYYRAGQKTDAAKVLELAPVNAEVRYWQAYLNGTKVQVTDKEADLVFPFRPETAELMQLLLKENDHWILKYHLALIHWNSNNLPAAKTLLDQIGNSPRYAPFYAARAKIYSKSDSAKALNDLETAKLLDPNNWRYGKDLISYWLANHQYKRAMDVSAEESKKFPSNYVLGMLHAKALILNKNYTAAERILAKISVLPNEGATGGRKLYRQVKLMLAAEAIKKGKFQKATEYISQAREWPEQLGSGKPYDEDIDERLEDFLASNMYNSQKNTSAWMQMTEKIISYTEPRKDNLRPSLNNLISAWALRSKNRDDEAVKMLKNIAEKNPTSTIAKWTLETYSGKRPPIPDEIKNNDDYLLLKETGML